jgi:hypothetical protein
MTARDEMRTTFPKQPRCAGLAILACLVASAPARAQGWHLDWVRAEGAEGCPDGAAITKAVSQRMGREAFAPNPGERQLEGLVSPEADGWQVLLAVRDEQQHLLGKRQHRVAGSDCAAVLAPTALIIALLVDTDEVASAKPRSVITPSAPTGAPPARVEPAALALGASTKVSVGQLPSWTPGLQLSLGRAVGPLRAGVFLEGYWPTRTPLGDGTFLAWQVNGGLDLCTGPARVGRAWFAGCALAAVGALVARGTGYSVDRLSVAPVVDAGLRLEAGWALGPEVSLTLAAAARAHLVAPRYAQLVGTEVTSDFRALPFSAELAWGVRVNVP